MRVPLSSLLGRHLLRFIEQHVGGARLLGKQLRGYALRFYQHPVGGATFISVQPFGDPLGFQQ